MTFTPLPYTMGSKQYALDQQLQDLQHRAFAYFRDEANPHTGLVLDKTAPDWPASIAATGLALSSYPVAVERGLMTMNAAVGPETCVRDPPSAATTKPAMIAV